MRTEVDLHRQFTDDGASNTIRAESLATETQTVRLLARAGKVIAPATVVAALGYHFGREYAHARSSYFGLDVSLLGFSPQDYVLRSVDAVFVPVLTAATAAMLLIAVHVLLVWWHSPRLLKTAGLVLSTLGTASLAVGLYALAWDVPVLDEWATFRDLMPALGTVLLLWGVSLLSRWLETKVPPRPQSAAIPAWFSSVGLGLALVVILASLFAGTTQWARTAGDARSKSLTERIRMMPRAAVYSDRLLNLAHDGISPVEVVGEKGSAYRFLYTGLRFYIRSGGKLFFLPEEWSLDSGRIIVLEDNDSIRLEFARGEEQ